MALLRQKKLSERYPNLLNELNDSEALIPAYARFQDQTSCMLRDDLKKIKESHFRKSYDQNLKKQLTDVCDVQFKGGQLDA